MVNERPFSGLCKYYNFSKSKSYINIVTRYVENFHEKISKKNCYEPFVYLINCNFVLEGVHSKIDLI